ncbi:MAG TPA: hypothetical protein VF538_15935 [Pyrinomonadaceae bacterium]|jgi:hypothetical protein
MPENEDATAAAAAPPETPAGDPARGSQNDPDPITRRVLLHELLIEEYETHTPFAERPDPRHEPPESRPETSRPTPLAWPELKMPHLGNVRQPALSRRQVEALRPENESDTDKKANSRGRVATFFTLMVRAQKAEADKRFPSDDGGARSEVLSDVYLEKLKRAWGKAKEEWKRAGKKLEEFERLERAKFVERAIAHELYGILEDYRERARNMARAKGERPSAEEIESSALASWVNEVHSDDARRDEKEPPPNAPAGASAAPADAKAGDSSAGEKHDGLAPEKM